MTYYTNLIENNPEWEMAGIFADHGISGIKDTTRPGFMQMIEACKKHKIDMILTKSLSRFSRNTLDSIRYIRLLKSLGVVIEFEKEGLNTGDLGSEIYLTWFSAFAQAESESLSQNVTMGKRRLFKEGKCPFQYKHFIGYRRGADGQPEIDPEGAKTIEHIFYGFLAGKTPAQLKTELEEMHILSPSGKTTWSKATIQNILRNEKYAGDVLLQKTFTADFLTKKVKKNHGEVTQYYVTDNLQKSPPQPICTRFEHHFHALKPHLHRRSFSDTLPENQRHLIALKRHSLWHMQKLCQLSQPAELRSTFFRNRNAVLCQDVLQLSNPLALSLEFFLSCVKVFHRLTLHLVVAGPFQF